MTKEMLIYWYTVNTPIKDITPNETFCIGEVDPEASKYAFMSDENKALSRIKEELSNSKVGSRIDFNSDVDHKSIQFKIVNFPNPNNKTNHFDKDVHKVLGSIGCKHIDGEWYNTSPDEIIRVLDHIETGASLGKEYKLRTRQNEAIKKFQTAMFENKSKFGLFAMPRFGKTITSFEMMNCLFNKYPNKKYIFFISAKLDAKQALKEDYYKFDKSCNFKLYMSDSDNRPTQEEFNNNKWLFFASKQWFDNKSLDDIKAKFPIINREDCLAIFFDEAHFARMTANSQRTIRLLNPTVQIDITGTPFRLKTNEDYDDNNSYVYSVLNEAEDYEKADDKISFRKNNPELIYITPKNEFFDKDSSFAEFFDSEKCAEQIKKWIKKTFYGGMFYIDNNKLDIQNAIIVVPPRRKFCDLFTRAVTELAKDEHLAIKCTKTSTTDNKDEDYIANNEERFKKWNSDCKTDHDNYHLLVTIGKGLQSVSFPDCHAVVMMSDMVSPEQYIQAAFRSKTPNDEKKEAYVIDYNKGRTLQIIDYFVKSHLEVQACASNYKREYELALSRINIKDHTLTRQNYTFEEIFQTFTSNWNVEKITDVIDFNLDLLNDRIDLSKINIKDLQKPQQLQLKLSDRGEYESDESSNEEHSYGDVEEDIPQTTFSSDELLQKQIEKLKQDLIANGYLPYGSTDEKDRLKDINPDDIQERMLPVGEDNQEIKVWSYMGGEGTLDDIFIDTSIYTIGRNPSLIRWKYVENKKFVVISGKEAHDSGHTDEKKARAFVNAIIRYLPAYFLVSGNPEDYEDFRKRFGRRSYAENYKERDLFRKFVDLGVDYRYVLEVLKACDIVSREQIISFCKDKANKCYDKNGNIIPEKVLELIWNYKRDGSRPVPMDLALKMRQDKNYDVVVCGGYYLTDDTTKIYITDSFPEAKIMELLRPNCKVIYSEHIVDDLERYKGDIMKFSSFIMNPPYGSLHLPILQKMVEYIVKNGGTGVSLQPVRWLQDPLWKYKNNSDANKYKKDFENNISNIEVIPVKQAVKYFTGSADITMDLGIYTLIKNDKFEYDSLSKQIYNVPDFSSTYKNINWGKYDGTQKHYVPIKSIFSGRGEGNSIGMPELNRMLLYKTHYGYFKDGVSYEGLCRNGLSLEEAFKENKRATQGNIYNWEIAIFKTGTEAKNFFDYLHLDAFKFFVMVTSTDQNPQTNYLPFVNDYTKAWTNKSFFDYFHISKKDQDFIENTMKKYKIK